jgi:hypothetical protein
MLDRGIARQGVPRKTASSVTGGVCLACQNASEECLANGKRSVMSDGLNALYKDQKNVFLNHNFVTVMPLQGKKQNIDISPEETLIDIDLRHGARSGDKVVEVLPFSLRTQEKPNGKAATLMSNRIKAYWLRWESKSAVSLTLGSDADYFFTSELNGCQIVAVGGPDGTLKVSHIAGNKDGSAWRRARANSFIAKEGAPGAESRRLSSASDNPGVPAYDNDDVLWTNVVGFRTKPLCGAQFWELYHQVVTAP